MSGESINEHPNGRVTIKHRRGPGLIGIEEYASIVDITAAQIPTEVPESELISSTQNISERLKGWLSEVVARSEA